MSNKDPEKANKRIREMRRWAKEFGHCTSCLKEKPEEEKDDGYAQCSYCRKRQQDWYAKNKKGGKN